MAFPQQKPTRYDHLLRLAGLLVVKRNHGNDVIYTVLRDQAHWVEVSNLRDAPLFRTYTKSRVQDFLEGWVARETGSAAPSA